MKRYACYIEEYLIDNRLCARLRDKETNKQIILETASQKDKMHFLEFLSAAKINMHLMPSVYKRNGDDIVAVYGNVIKETSESIHIRLDADTSYMFE